MYEINTLLLLPLKIYSSIKDLTHNTEAHKNIVFIEETRFYKQL